MHFAAEEGSLSLMVAVLENLICQETSGSNANAAMDNIINLRDIRGQTPLSLACAMGHTECVRFLLTNGADRTLPDLKGNLPLHLAALWGHLRSSMLLLEYGDLFQVEAARGLVSAPNGAGLTPLHLAVWGRHPSSVALLLGHGADLAAKAGSPDVPDIVPCHAGTTPLHLAATRGHIAIAKEILKSYFESVIEPMMGIEGGPTPEAIAVAQASDPRMMVNQPGQMPWEVATLMGFHTLSAILRPLVPLDRLLAERGNSNLAGGVIYGAPSLKTIAAVAINWKLLDRITRLMEEEKRRQGGGGHAGGRGEGEAEEEAVGAAEEGVATEPALHSFRSPQKRASLTPQQMEAASPRTPLPPSPPQQPAPADATPFHDPPSPSVSSSPRQHHGGSSLQVALELAGLPGSVSDNIRSEEGEMATAIVAVAAGGSLSLQLVSPSILPSSCSDQITPVVSPSDAHSGSSRQSSPGGGGRGGGGGGSQTILLGSAFICSGRNLHPSSPIAPSNDNSRRDLGNWGSTGEELAVGGVGMQRGLAALEEGVENVQVSLIGVEEAVRDVAVAARARVEEGRQHHDKDHMGAVHEKSDTQKSDDSLLGGGDDVISIKKKGLGRMEVIDVEEECGVCFDAPSRILVRPCNHLVCSGCALKLCSTQGNARRACFCPFCRGIVGDFDLVIAHD